MIILDGKKIRDEIKPQLLRRAVVLSARGAKFVPTIAIVQIGDNQQSTVYIRQKKLFAESIGARAIHVHLPEIATFADVSAAIGEQNVAPDVHGIILQLPLPSHLSSEKDALIDLINPQKDVDGLTSENQKLLEAGTPRFIPATAKAVMTILDFYNIPVAGKNVAVLGRSKLVGWPTSRLLALKGAHVTTCHSKTPNTREIALVADIVIVAIGKPSLVDRSYIKDGAVVIDVGMTKVGTGADGKLFGDVDHPSVEKIASAITPVPGGVGPVTVLSLFANLIESAEKINKTNGK